ncbi:MAG: putative acetyltransferase [Pseudonocardiales bacterium]|nr:putative acetyltransferase [Pseudonocardiales bacterium]
MQASEPATVRRLLTTAFADDGRVADLVEALTARPEDVGLPLVAESAGTVVGYTQLSRGWIDADRQLVEALVLSPLAVAPAHQRRGIGRALSDAAVEQARQLGAPAVFLEGDPKYYAKLGWQPAGAQGFTAPSVRIPDAAFQVVVLPARQPWMTGALVYNDTFWSLDCVGLRR